MPSDSSGRAPVCANCGKPEDKHVAEFGNLYCWPRSEFLELTHANWPRYVEQFTPPRTEAPETRRIPQEDPMGCGVACLAMVSGRTYADVRAGINPAQVEHGLADQTILWWLNRNGFWHRRSWMDGEWSYPVPTSGVALMLTHDAHWVVLVDGVVLDPARPEPLPSYDFRQAIEVHPASAPPRTEAPVSREQIEAMIAAGRDPAPYIPTYTTVSPSPSADTGGAAETRESFAPEFIEREFRSFQAGGCRDQTFYDNGPHFVESLLATLASLRARLAESETKAEYWMAQFTSMSERCAEAECALLESIAGLTQKAK